MGNNLLDELLALPEANAKERRCKAGKILNQLDGQYLEAAENLINNNNITLVFTVSTLRKAGFQIGATTVAAHRVKQCLCFNN